MLLLLRKYPVALLLAIILHAIIAIAFFLGIQHEDTGSDLPMSIQATVIRISELAV